MIPRRTRSEVRRRRRLALRSSLRPGTETSPPRMGPENSGAPRRRGAPEFSGPILGGEVSVPGRRELRRAKRRRRRTSERVLRGIIGLVVVLLVVAGLGYG